MLVVWAFYSNFWCCTPKHVRQKPTLHFVAVSDGSITTGWLRWALVNQNELAISNKYLENKPIILNIYIYVNITTIETTFRGSDAGCKSREKRNVGRNGCRYRRLWKRKDERNQPWTMIIEQHTGSDVDRVNKARVLCQVMKTESKNWLLKNHLQRQD